MRKPLFWHVLLALSFAALAAPCGLAAQRVRVEARVSPAAARVGDVVVLDITVSTAGPAPEFSAPLLPPGLRITGSNDFSAYSFRMPGGRERTTRRELALAAEGPGHFVIPPMAVRVSGEVYRTQPLRIDISGRSASRSGTLPPSYVTPATPRAPGGSVAAGDAAGPDDEVMLQAWASPDTVYVGQQVTVRADALFSVDVRPRLASAPQFDAPSAPGFWVYELPGHDGSVYRPVRGRMYEVQTFRRAFFPLGPGRYFLPAAHLSYAVRRGFLSAPESYDLRSDSIAVVVLPLPAENRPADYSGAVGRFTASARLEPDTVGAGEAASLTVEVRGDGNIKAVPPPRLAAVQGLQVFPPVEEADVRADAEAVGGVKRFTWVLVPSRPGPIAIPALELPFFDPTVQRYDVARTAPLGLRVGPGSGLPGAGAGGTAPLVAGSALRPLQERDSGAGAAPWVRSPVFPALLSLPLVALAALGFEARRRRVRPVVKPRRGAAMLDGLRRDMTPLRARAGAEPAGEGAPGHAELAEELLDTVRRWLAARLGVPELERMPPTRLDGALRSAGVRPVTAAALGLLAGRLEEVRYLPLAPAPAEQVAWVDEAERLLAEVHAGAGRRGRRPAGPVVGLVLAGAAVLAAGARPLAAASLAQGASPGAQMAAQAQGVSAGAQVAASAPATSAAGGQGADGAFAAGVAAYRASQFTRASELFSAYTAAHPERWAGWYDLGNSAYRSGHHGLAIWAWLRALELAPRNADARQNLALAGADPGMVDAATPPVALSEDELVLGAGVLWLLGAAALLGLRLRRRNSLLLGGGAAVGLAAALAVMAGVARLGPERGVMVQAAPLLGAPTPHADAMGQIAEGLPVLVVERRGGWVRVRRQDVAGPAAGTGQDSQEGWVERGRVGSL